MLCRTSTVVQWYSKLKTVDSIILVWLSILCSSRFAIAGGWLKWRMISIFFTLPQQCLLAIMPLPTSLLYCAVTLILGHIVLEVGFFYYYHWHLLPYANNQITYEPSAPYRDYQQIEDRSKLLIRILDRIDKRMLTTNHSRQKIYYDFIESWFQKKNEDVPYKEFSEQFDMANWVAGL